MKKRQENSCSFIIRSVLLFTHRRFLFAQTTETFFLCAAHLLKQAVGGDGVRELFFLSL